MIWTVDLVYRCRSSRMYYVNRKPAGTTAVRRYYSSYSGWPPSTMAADDCRIQVVMEADEAVMAKLAEQAKNVALFMYGYKQLHFMPICWLPAAETWGYRASRAIGIWLEGKKYSLDQLCTRCLNKINLATAQCIPLAEGCILPFCLSEGTVYKPTQFMSYYLGHRPDYSQWPRKDFGVLKEYVSCKEPTVDDLE